MIGRTRDTTAGYTQADMDAVSDNPEWNEATTARSKSFSEMFPDTERREDGRKNAPAKREITLLVDERVIDRFEATGDGWKSRMSEALAKAAGL